MPRPINELELRVVGMSRSGNHAIVDWIVAQAHGRTCLLNCGQPGENPFLWARPLAPDAPGHRATYDLDIEAERAGRWSRKDLLVHSYEDVFLGGLARADDERHVGPSRRRLDVLILRDPYNLFASRRAAGAGVLSPYLAMHVWSQHAREFLGHQRRLPGPVVPVSYNRWVDSRSYRRRLAEILGLEFDDGAASRVPACAGGSSFDGVLHDGSATSMRVLDRWRRYADDPSYRQLFTPDVHALAREAFGPMRAADELAAPPALAA